MCFELAIHDIILGAAGDRDPLEHADCFFHLRDASAIKVFSGAIIELCCASYIVANSRFSIWMDATFS